MICPQCGYDMGNKNKCLRCGYEAKNLSVVVKKEEPKDKENENNVIDIDPCNVFLTHPYGYEDEFGTGFGSPFDDPFVSIIDSFFGDPIGDLLGGLFGFDMSPPRRQQQEDRQPTKRKKQGPIVVVDDIEIIEDDKEGKKKSDKKTEQETHKPKTERSHTPPHKSGGKIKNMFKRNNDRK